MININNINLIRQFISSYWISVCSINHSYSISYPFSLQLSPPIQINSNGVFIKKRIDPSSLPFKKSKPSHHMKSNSTQYLVQKQEPIVISKAKKQKLSVEVAYSINSVQWSNQKKEKIKENLIESKFDSIKPSMTNELTSNSNSDISSTSNLIRDAEILQLNRKLYNYKHQNNIIKDENKKLLEVIKLISPNHKENTNSNSLLLSSINPIETTSLYSTRNDLKELRDNIKQSSNQSLNLNDNTKSLLKTNNPNKSDIHYKDGNNKVNESSLEDLEERLNNEFLNNKYNIPLQINVGVIFEKYDNEDDKESMEEKEIIPFHLMNKEKLYQNIVKSSNEGDIKQKSSSRRFSTKKQRYYINDN